MREAAGLSQQNVADELGISQPAYASWERRPTALKPEQLIHLARLFDCSIDELLGLTDRSKRKNGPSGKMRTLFDAASSLPRGQQQKIFDFLQPFVTEHSK